MPRENPPYCFHINGSTKPLWETACANFSQLPPLYVSVHSTRTHQPVSVPDISLCIRSDTLRLQDVSRNIDVISPNHQWSIPRMHVRDCTNFSKDAHTISISAIYGSTGDERQDIRAAFIVVKLDRWNHPHTVRILSPELDEKNPSKYIVGCSICPKVQILGANNVPWTDSPEGALTCELALPPLDPPVSLPLFHAVREGNGSPNIGAYAFTSMTSFPFHVSGLYEFIFRLDMRGLPYACLLDSDEMWLQRKVAIPIINGPPKSLVFSKSSPDIMTTRLTAQFDKGSHTLLSFLEVAIVDEFNNVVKNCNTTSEAMRLALTGESNSDIELVGRTGASITKGMAHFSKIQVRARRPFTQCICTLEVECSGSLHDGLGSIKPLKINFDAHCESQTSWKKPRRRSRSNSLTKENPVTNSNEKKLEDSLKPTPAAQSKIGVKFFSGPVRRSPVVRGRELSHIAQSKADAGWSDWHSVDSGRRSKSVKSTTPTFRNPLDSIPREANRNRSLVAMATSPPSQATESNTTTPSHCDSPAFSTPQSLLAGRESTKLELIATRETSALASTPIVFRSPVESSILGNHVPWEDRQPAAATSSSSTVPPAAHAESGTSDPRYSHGNVPQQQLMKLELFSPPRTPMASVNAALPPQPSPHLSASDKHRPRRPGQGEGDSPSQLPKGLLPGRVSASPPRGTPPIPSGVHGQPPLLVPSSAHIPIVPHASSDSRPHSAAPSAPAVVSLVVIPSGAHAPSAITSPPRAQTASVVQHQNSPYTSPSIAYRRAPNSSRDRSPSPVPPLRSSTPTSENSRGRSGEKERPFVSQEGGSDSSTRKATQMMQQPMTPMTFRSLSADRQKDSPHSIDSHVKREISPVNSRTADRPPLPTTAAPTCAYSPTPKERTNEQPAERQKPRIPRSPSPSGNLSRSPSPAIEPSTQSKAAPSIARRSPHEHPQSFAGPRVAPQSATHAPTHESTPTQPRRDAPSTGSETNLRDPRGVSPHEDTEFHLTDRIEHVNQWVGEVRNTFRWEAKEDSRGQKDPEPTLKSPHFTTRRVDSRTHGTTVFSPSFATLSPESVVTTPLSEDLSESQPSPTPQYPMKSPVERSGEAKAPRKEARSPPPISEPRPPVSSPCTVSNSQSSSRLPPPHPRPAVEQPVVPGDRDHLFQFVKVRPSISSQIPAVSPVSSEVPDREVQLQEIVRELQKENEDITGRELRLAEKLIEAQVNLGVERHRARQIEVEAAERQAQLGQTVLELQKQLNELQRQFMDTIPIRIPSDTSATRKVRSAEWSETEHDSSR